MMALMMVAMLKVGHLNMNSSSITCSVMPLFPRSFSLFSTGMRRGSWMGSGSSLSQLVWTKNQLVSVRVQAAWVVLVSRSRTVASLPDRPAIMKQTGPPMTSVLSLLTASAKVVWSSSTLLTSQTVGQACLARTLIKSWLKSLAFLVSTLTEKAPWRTPVSAKTLPATVSTVKTFLSPEQYSTLTINLEKIYHISKSKFLPCRILPSSFLMRRPVQALKVENSYMKLRKKRRSKGRPLSSATAETQATKSWYLNSFLANHSTPSKKPLGMGSRSKNSMKRVRGSLQSLMMGAQRTLGESARLTLQVRGAWLSMGPTLGTTVARATAKSSAQIKSLFMIDQLLILNSHHG